MSLAYDEYYTIYDYKKWQGDWELIYGKPYAMSPFALPKHQRLSGRILSQFIQNLCQECEALMESEIYISNDTVLRPDVMVICYPITDKLTKAPEIVIEVISPSTARRDEILKFDIYQKEGIKYYGLAYPEEKKIKIFKLKDGKYIKEGDFLEDDSYTFDIKNCKFDIEFKKVF
jgi:Uma2 family endonuclease